MNGPIEVIGAPTDYGTNRRGVDMGPSALRYAGFLEELESSTHSVTDSGDLDVPRTQGRAGRHDSDARFLSEVMEVSSELADRVGTALDAGRFPIVLGGDHSISIGTLAGSARDQEIGALWFDAHADFNTPETSPSGNVHGMSLAAVLGRDSFGRMDWAQAPGVREQNIVWVGLRALDPEEREAVRACSGTAFTMSDIDEDGISTVVEEALECAANGVDGVHVSLDMDFVDPNEAPGVGTPVRGGVTYREAHAAMEYIGDWDALRSFEVVEVNPILDSENQTASLASELVGSVVGTQLL